VKGGIDIQGVIEKSRTKFKIRIWPGVGRVGWKMDLAGTKKKRVKGGSLQAYVIPSLK